MHKGYKNVDPRAIKEDGKAVVSNSFDKAVKNRINVYREQGYSEEDILGLLFDECINQSAKKEETKKPKTKTFTYQSNFYKK
jgi:hypothetical protein